MKAWKKMLPAWIALAAISLSACGGAEEEKEVSYREEMNSEELEKGRASFQMDENLVVEANVTPRETFEKKYAVYQCEIASELDLSGKDFRKAPKISGHSIKEWEKKLAELQPGQFNGSPSVKNRSVDAVYKGDNGRKYDFSVNWKGGAKNFKASKRTFAPEISFNDREWMHSNGQNDWEWLLWAKKESDFPHQEMSAFELDKQETADKLRNFLTEMSGRKVSGEYEFIPVNDENVNSEPKFFDIIGLEPDDYDDYNVVETATFLFYYDIDGLPFKNVTMPYSVPWGSAKDLDDRCHFDGFNGGSGPYISPLVEPAQQFSINEDGICSIDCSNTILPGEVYQEQKQVVSPNEALKWVGKYYHTHKMALQKMVHVTDIELDYASYYARDEDDKIIPVITPVWVVRVYDETESSFGATYFAYDAFTGACLSMCDPNLMGS